MHSAMVYDMAERRSGLWAGGVSIHGGLMARLTVMKTLWAQAICALSALSAGAIAASADVPLASIAVYQPSDWSRNVTPCDRLAAHPDDPEAVAPGLSRAEIDTEAALKACHEAVASDPHNPRLNYQLARVFGYAGRHEEGQSFRDSALKAGYPQSLFVIGYIRLENWDGRGADPCYGGELIRRSAEAGRFAGLVGFAHYALMGRFEGCPADMPRIDSKEMLGFLAAARDETTDFYRLALIDQLEAQLKEQ